MGVVGIFEGCEIQDGCRCVFENGFLICLILIGIKMYVILKFNDEEFILYVNFGEERCFYMKNPTWPLLPY